MTHHYHSPTAPSSTVRRWLSAAAVFCALATTAGGAQAQGYINATVGGELAPGVYGRINIGNAMPPPPVIYQEPVIIQRPAVVVPRSPIYLYVPPGHSRNWSKHCMRYNACNQPVYFVQEPPPRRAPPHHRGPHARGHDDHRWHGHPPHRHGSGKHRDHPRDDRRGGPGKGHHGHNR